MLTDRETKARYLAYRWFRSRHHEATHREAWDFAQGNWTEFLVLVEATVPLDADRPPERPPVAV
jgi:hypothetical protein